MLYSIVRVPKAMAPSFSAIYDVANINSTEAYAVNNYIVTISINSNYTYN